MPIDTSGGHHEMDYAEHVKTYALFQKGVIYGTITAAAVVILLVVFVY